MLRPNNCFSVDTDKIFKVLGHRITLIIQMKREKDIEDNCLLTLIVLHMGTNISARLSFKPNIDFLHPEKVIRSPREQDISLFSSNF